MLDFFYEKLTKKADVKMLVLKGLAQNPFNIFEAVWIDLSPDNFTPLAIEFGESLKEKVAQCIIDEELLLPKLLRQIDDFEQLFEDPKHQLIFESNC